MAKFMIVGDIQFRGVNPMARKDDFMAALETKLDEVHKIAEQYKTAAILTPGDLFDSPLVSWSVFCRLMAILQKSPCPWVTIPGNHDLYGGNMDTYFRTPMAALEQAGVVHVLRSPEQTVDLSPTAFDSVMVTGRGFDWEMDTHPGTYATPTPTGSDIHMVHGMLVTSPLPITKHTLIKDVQTNARVTICGHNHLGFGIIKRDDEKWFINPGALCRESAHEAEMQRQVQVCILEINKNASAVADEIKAELLPITSAKPAEEVLSREHIEAQALQREKMDYFLELLSSEGEGRFLEVQDIIDGITEKESLPTTVKGEALKRIAKAREDLGSRRCAG